MSFFVSPSLLDSSLYQVRIKSELRRMKREEEQKVFFSNERSMICCFRMKIQEQEDSLAVLQRQTRVGEKQRDRDQDNFSLSQ